MGRRRPGKAVDNCHCNPFGDVSFNPFFVLFFSLPEYLIPSFIGLITRTHAASNLNRIFSTRTTGRLCNVRVISLSHIEPIYSFFFSNWQSPLSCPSIPWLEPSPGWRWTFNPFYWQQSTRFKLFTTRVRMQTLEFAGHGLIPLFQGSESGLSVLRY